MEKLFELKYLEGKNLQITLNDTKAIASKNIRTDVLYDWQMAWDYMVRNPFFEYWEDKHYQNNWVLLNGIEETYIKNLSLHSHTVSDNKTIYNILCDNYYRGYGIHYRNGYYYVYDKSDPNYEGEGKRLCHDGWGKGIFWPERERYELNNKSDRKYHILYSDDPGLELPHVKFGSVAVSRIATVYGEWVSNLSPSQKCTIHSQTGYGIFELKNNELYDKFLEKIEYVYIDLENGEVMDLLLYGTDRRTIR